MDHCDIFFYFYIKVAFLIFVMNKNYNEMENYFKIEHGRKVETYTPKDTYVLTWNERHGDADQSMPTSMTIHSMDELWFMLWFSKWLDRYRQYSDLDEYSKVLNKYSKELLGSESYYITDWSDWCSDVYGYDCVYSSCYCGVDAMKLYYYDEHGVKYEEEIDGSTYISLVKMGYKLDCWFIDKYPHIANELQGMICNAALEDKKDVIEANKMGLI